MSITVKRLGHGRYEIELDEILEMTVFEVKGLISTHWTDLEIEQQKLIFKGKILADDSTLKDCGVQDSAFLVVVSRKRKKQTSKSPPKPVGNSNSPTQNPTPTNPSSGTNSTQPARPNNEATPVSHPANQFAFATPPLNMQNMMNPQQMMQNPEMMQQMMQNPMFQNMMDSMMQNPDMLRGMFENNPQLQQILDQNPQMRHVLNDPETMRQAMEAVRNPEVYQDMLRNQDRAIANISNMPGGFNALSRMYNQVQSPMEDALASMHQQREATSISEVDPSSGPTNNAMPNPFSNNAPSRQTQQQSTPRSVRPPMMMGPGMANNPFLSNMFSGANASVPTNPQEAYATQLVQLSEMGFSNEQENINALIQAGGQVQGAVNILMTNRGLM